MRYILLCFACLLPHAATSQPPATPKLSTIFGDDFSTDTRSEYSVTGDVSWQQGELGLAEGASITRPFDGNAWARVEVEIQGHAAVAEPASDAARSESQAALATDDSQSVAESELRVWFRFDGATDFLIIWKRKSKDGQPLGEITLVDTFVREGKLVGQLVKQSTIKTSEQLAIEYRYGLVTVTQADAPVLLASLDNGRAVVKSTTLAAAKNGVQLRRLTALAVRPQELTEQQQQLLQQEATLVAQSEQLDSEQEFAKAVPILEKALQIRQDTGLTQSFEHAVILNNLAQLYQRMDKHELAAELQERACECIRVVLGEQHPGYAASLNNLGAQYYERREYARAEALFQQALEIKRSVLGEETASYANGLNSLALLYEKTGDARRAEQMHLQALRIRKATLAPNHPAYADSLNNLAAFYKHRGDYAKAEPLYQQAVAIGEARGGNQPSHATSLSNLANLYQSMGKYSLAEKLCRQALEIRRVAFGTKHSDYAGTLNTLASVLERKGDYDRAEPLYQQVLEIYRSVFGEKHPRYASSLNGLGTFYRKRGDFDRAERFLTEAMQIRQSIHGTQHPDFANSLFNLALLQSSRGEYKRAEPRFKQAAEIWKNAFGQQHPNYAATLSSLASLYENIGDRKQAETLYKQAIEIDRNRLGEGHPEYAMSLNNLGLLYLEMGDYVQAEQLFRKVLKIRETMLGPEHPDYAGSLTSMARLAYDLGDYTEAESLYQRALEIEKKVLGEDHPTYATSLNNLAVLYQSSGDLSGAESLYLQAAEIRRATLGDQHPAYASSLGNLAALYESTADYARAESLNQQALAIRESVLGQRHPSYATSLGNLAMLYKKMGDDERAEPLCRQALKIREASVGKTHPDYATNLSQLAGLVSANGDHVAAESLYRQALRIRKDVFGDRHPDSTITLNNLALEYRELGDHARAEQLTEQVLEIRESVLGKQHPLYAASLNNLAWLRKNRGDFEGAEPLYKQAVQITRSSLGEQHPDYATTLNNLALLYRSWGDDETAAPLFKQSLDIQRRLLDASSVAQSERQQNQNQVSLRSVLDTYLASAMSRHDSEGELLESVWRWKGAVTLRQQAYRRLAANPQLAPLFEELQSVSRQLSAMATQSPLPPTQSVTPAQQAGYERRRKVWADRFATLNRQREDLEQSIAAESKEFRRVQQPLTVTEVQQSLEPDTALLDFLEYRHNAPDPMNPGNSVVENRYLALIVRPDREPVVASIGPSEVLHEAIIQWRRRIDRDDAGAGEEETAAARLRRMLWLPIEEHLDSVGTIIISPDSVLGTLPFAALPGEEADRFLIEKYRLVSIPFANLLPRLMEPTRSLGNPGGLLVVGDVDYDFDLPSRKTPPSESLVESNVDLGQLNRTRGDQGDFWEKHPGFREELRIVQSLHQQRFGPTAVMKTLSGNLATEDSLLREAPRHQTLHLITHAFFSAPEVKSIGQSEVTPDEVFADASVVDPFINTFLPGLLSGLVMAGANHPAVDPDDASDGILRASEIEASSMQNVDLVVLSACETGLGAVAGGEGLTGLQRAFHVAGARGVVASLWEVDDRATQELMSRFYTHLWIEKKSRVDALREAQLWLLKHPQELEVMGVRGATTRQTSQTAPV